MTALVLALTSIGTSAPGGGDAPSGDPGAQRLTAPRVTGAVLHLRHRIVDRRGATWRHQDAVEHPRTRTAYAERRTHSVPYLGWIKQLWGKRAHKAWQLRVELDTSAVAAIRFVFGPYADEALRVASCESGLSRHATNGQYLGLFQMGSYARSRYGHGDTFLEQARAAYAYFVESGRDWSPWQCRPWGLAW